MQDTLESLHHAVVANPEDHTVRLVYADALDERDGPGDAARAEFIRAQIELAAQLDEDKQDAELLARVRHLFEAHWLDWWRPYCVAAGFPEPHEPGKRRRDPVPPGGRRARRSRNWPYAHTALDRTILAAEYGMYFRFVGGFPDEVRITGFGTPDFAPELPHRWGEVLPVRRLHITQPIGPREWSRVNGPHLKRLPELVFDRLSPDLAPHVAESPHLAKLRRLTVTPIGATSVALRALTVSPVWKELRELRIATPLPPDRLDDLARRCRLRRLEELEIALGTVADPFAAIGAMLIGAVLSAFSPQSIAGGGWANYGPAIAALASAAWVVRLRRLKITTGAMTRFAAELRSRMRQPRELLPDAAVVALGDALNHKRLQRLEMPDAIISQRAKRELTRRLGARVAFGE